jgi:hypothetical protein
VPTGDNWEFGQRHLMSILKNKLKLFVNMVFGISFA